MTKQIVVVGAAFVLATSSRAMAASCDSLASVALPNATVTSAKLIEAGAFTPAPAPGNAERGGGAGGRGANAGRGADGAAARGGGAGGGRGAAPPSFTDLPAFCRVLGNIQTSASSSVAFEVWLPAAGWNGNFLANGFAFYGGTMNPTVLAGALRRGYATATTNLGGDGTQSGAYLSGHPEAIKDWGERGWHETTLKAKALVSAFYGNAPKLSYWDACGGGTRQGLMEVTKYPTDYDAIAAGGLSNGTTFFTFSQVAQWEATHKTPGSLISRDKLQVLHQAALNACDAKDGVKDGIIQDPEHCGFDPAVTACKNGDAPDCLTAEQVEAARKSYAGSINPRTKQVISGGAMVGSELSWNATPSDAPGGFAADFFKYLAFQDPTWDYRTRPIDYDKDFATANRPEIAAVSAVNPDLKAFLARGGKVLFYDGWNDNAIPPMDGVNYYKNIVKTVGKAADDSVRLFMIPDSGHCPAGAAAANGYIFDPLPVITAWKEQGRTPNQIVVAHKTNGVEDRRMLVCPYPQQAVYDGRGNAADEASYACRKP